MKSALFFALASNVVAFQIAVSAGNQLLGYVSSYHIGAGLNIASVASTTAGNDFIISQGNLTQLNVGGGVPPGAFVGYFTGDSGLLPLNIGVGGVNNTWSVSSTGVIEIDGNSNWFMCDSVATVFGTTVSNAIQINFDAGIEIPGACHPVVLMSSSATSTTSSSTTFNQTSSTVTSAPSSSTSTTPIYGEFALAVLGASANGYVDPIESNGSFIAISGANIYPFTLRDGVLALQNGNHDLFFTQTTSIAPLVIGGSTANAVNATFSLASGRIVVNGLNNWILCRNQNSTTITNQIYFQFGRTAPLHCSKIEIIAERINPGTTTTSMSFSSGPTTSTTQRGRSTRTVTSGQTSNTRKTHTVVTTVITSTITVTCKSCDSSTANSPKTLPTTTAVLQIQPTRSGLPTTILQAPSNSATRVGSLPALLVASILLTLL